MREREGILTTGISVRSTSWFMRFSVALLLILAAALLALASGPNRTAFAVTIPAPTPTLLGDSPTCGDVFEQFFSGSTGIMEIVVGFDFEGLTFTRSAGSATVVGTLDETRTTITTFTLTPPAGEQINDTLVVMQGGTGANGYPYPDVFDATLTSGGLTTPDGLQNTGKSFCLTTGTPTPTPTPTNTPTPTPTDTPTPPANEGCTPGFWKQPQHFDSWTGFSQGQTLENVFNVPDAFGLDSM